MRVCVHVSAPNVVYRVKSAARKTLPSCLSDEIKDKLLPLNPLIKEMSVIADKLLTQIFEKMTDKPENSFCGC